MIAAIARRLLADMGSSAGRAKPSGDADGGGLFSVKTGSNEGWRAPVREASREGGASLDRFDSGLNGKGACKRRTGSTLGALQ
jgi:hypothetical protein